MPGIIGKNVKIACGMSRRQFLRRAGAVAAGAVPLLHGLALAEQPCEPPAFNFVHHDLCFVRLPCGRRLAFSEVGDADASWIIINHHGLFSGRIDSENCLDLLRCLPGVRLITPDRPGMGKSDPDPHCDFLSWPADVAALADALQIQRFAVMAVSDGAPFGLAVARAMPDRVSVVSLQSPVGPFEFLDRGRNFAVFGATMAETHYAFTRFCISRYAEPFVRHPERIPLRYALSGPKKHEQMVGSSPHINDAFAQGPDAIMHYIAEIGTPWAWWLKDVPTKVKIMHGCQDRYAPPVTAQRLANALPNAELRFYPNEGHASLLVKYVGDRLAAAMPDGLAAAP